ncbi:ComEA family DNA-binding protein [Singulisphaera rosea]
MNTNTASVAELEALPGIGKVLARRIVEGRPYATVDELERVPGIGPKRLAEIRPLTRAE